MKNKRVITYSWKKILEDSHILLSLVAKTYTPDYIVTFYRNGMFPLLLFSHFFDLEDSLILKPHKQYLTDLVYPSQFFIGKKVLILDDIYDSGETIEKTRDWLLTNLSQRAPELKVAVIDCKEDKTGRVDYYVNKVEKDVWIYYPWETRQEDGE